MVELPRQVGHRLLWRFPRRSPSSDEARIAEERLWLYNSLAWIDVGNPAGVLLNTLLALNVAERYSIDWAVGGWLTVLGYACDLVPLPRLSRFYHRKGLDHAKKAAEQDSWQTRYVLAAAHQTVGQHEYVATGDWVSARDHLRQAREEMIRLGRIRDWAAATGTLELMLLDQGDLSGALALCREVMTSSQETATTWPRRGAGWMLERCCLPKGSWTRRRHTSSMRPPISPPLDMAQWGVRAQGLIAHCHLKQGELD